MRNETEQTILKRAQQFEAQALEEIFDTFSPRIFRYAYRILGDEDLAKDCTSETFSRFLKALKQGNGPDNYIQAYLFRIAHNWITDYFRSKVPDTVPIYQDLPAKPSDAPEIQVNANMEQQLLRKMLSLLTPEQQQVVVLRYLEDMEHKAIAEVMNKPVGAVKALQHRGIESLRRLLSRYEAEKYDQ